MSENINLVKEITELLTDKKYNIVKKKISGLNEVDIAEIIEKLESDKMIILFRLLPKQLAAFAFAYLETEAQEYIISVLTDKELTYVLKELFIDDTADLLDEMPANVAKRILKVTSSEDRNIINEILKYPEDSAGSVLTTEFVDLKASMTVSQALDYIRNYGPDKETIYTCYVTDDARHLIGVLTVRELLLNKHNSIVSDIMKRNVIWVSTTEDRENVAQLFAKYDLIALPVVDAEQRLVGIITVDDVVDIIQQETTEDIEKMAAIVPSDKPYLKTGVIDTFKKRIPWLLLLMISATFTGMIITSFENALSKFVILTAFIPMLMDTGGNSGSQASVTVIRSLALKDIEFSDIFKVIWKEIRVSLICGVVLSALNFLKLIIVDRIIMGNSEVTISIALIICITLIVTVLCAKVIGCTLPLFASKLGFDPAVMASPFITTLVDAISLVVYFRIASLILRI